MTSRRPNDLHPAMQEFWSVLQRLAKDELGISIFLTCTYRSNNDQERLYAQGRTARGLRVTNARAGQSPHNQMPSVALDFAVMGDDGDIDWSPFPYIRVAQIARRLGADAGAFWRGFRDNPHIQMPNWSIGKTYPTQYRFMRVSSAPNLKRPAQATRSRVRVFDAGANHVIGTGTLVQVSKGLPKVYIMPEFVLPIKGDPLPLTAGIKQVRAFNAKTNGSLGVASLVGDKVYLTAEQSGGL